jgi:hypothetical protein
VVAVIVVVMMYKGKVQYWRASAGRFPQLVMQYLKSRQQAMT